MANIRPTNSPVARTLGPISDLERHLPSDWWRTLFNSLYLKTDALQLAGFRPAMADTGVVAGGAADLELWVGIERMIPVWGGGSVSWDKPELRNVTADAQGISADSLSAQLHWRRRNGKWRIGVNRVMGTGN